MPPVAPKDHQRWWQYFQVGGAPWLWTLWETTPLKSNMEPQNGGGWKIICSFSIGGFSGSMLVVWVSKGVHVHPIWVKHIEQLTGWTNCFTPHFAIYFGLFCRKYRPNLSLRQHPLKPKSSLTPELMFKVQTTWSPAICPKSYVQFAQLFSNLTCQSWTCQVEQLSLRDHEGLAILG